MSCQAGDPRSLLDPKIGWGEVTGPNRFRLVLSVEEARIAVLQDAHPDARAFVRAVEQRLEQEGLAFIGLDE